MNIKIYYWRCVAFTLFSTLLIGCASTRMVSQVNTELASRSFTKILVNGNFQSLEYRQLVEDKLCDELSRITTCIFLKSYDVFFPGQEYSMEQIANRLTELGIDGILIIQPKGSGITSAYVPQMSHTNISAWISGNTVSGSSTTMTYGGYRIGKPWANFEAILWSVADDKVAWYATAITKGYAYNDWGDLVKSASSKTIRKLIADEIFRIPKDTDK